MLCNESKNKPKNLTYAQVYNKALELFDGDRDKTNIWWMQKHEELDNKSPYEMVKEGNGRYLMRMMERCGV